MDELTPRMTVLEQIAKDTRETLSAIRGDLATLQRDVSRTREEMARADDLAALQKEVSLVRADVAHLDGRIYGLPTTWQMLTAVMVGPGVVMALLLTIFRLFGGH